ncbi:hypothetical protein CYMTET_7347, partial [Cymbomonas tetramitiformis]
MADHSPAISDKAFEKFLNASVSSESGDLEEALEDIKSKFANNPAVAGGIAARLEGRDVDSSRDSDLLNSTDFAVNSNRSSAEVSTGAPGSLKKPQATESPLYFTKTAGGSAGPSSGHASSSGLARLSQLQASIDLGTDSESEEVEKRRFFKKGTPTKRFNLGPEGGTESPMRSISMPEEGELSPRRSIDSQAPGDPSSSSTSMPPPPARPKPPPAPTNIRPPGPPPPGVNPPPPSITSSSVLQSLPAPSG